MTDAVLYDSRSPTKAASANECYLNTPVTNAKGIRDFISEIKMKYFFQTICLSCPPCIKVDPIIDLTTVKSLYWITSNHFLSVFTLLPTQKGL